MRCINDGIVQKYIDGESTPVETTHIENHIMICNKCKTTIENQHILATSIRKAINLLEKDSIDIPKFEITSYNTKNHFLSTKKLVYIIAAACILLFVLVITQKKGLKNNDKIIFEIGSVTDVDANRPVSKFPLVINIIDAKGNISEYYIK
ncbi:MAG: hypothetical protein ABR927_14810 [Bacteroidales bacterium]|jgi:predicted anti-sigma-YlaC factor YlaD